MRACVVGSGAREHAIASALSRNAEVVVTPGNPGMAALGVECSAEPPEALSADLYVIGPEMPLVDGLADRLRGQGRTVFGPGADGARLEGSKAWMKQVLTDARVPTPGYRSFADDEVEAAIDYLESLPGPWVVKTDGLAAGKGVFVTDDRDRAADDVRAKLSGRSTFGAAGRRVVIEEGLIGPELSLMAICDGKRAVALAAAQDFKRLRDGDEGPNTGGMGAFSPVPGAGLDLIDEVMRCAIEPTLASLVDRGIDYRGVLYAGLMLTADGPRVLEFNVRFGDPETQVLLPRWEGDVAAVLDAAATGSLDAVDRPRFAVDAVVGVVLASAGYPDDVKTGDPIAGLAAAAAIDGVEVYAAGVGRAAAAKPVPTANPAPGELLTSGGRVLTVVGRGPSLASARDLAYRAVPVLSWPGMHYRTDIAAAEVT